MSPHSTGAISVAVDSTSSTSLTISWSLADSAVVTGYSISYSNTDTQCFTDSHTVSGIAAGETSHTLTDLEEATEYTITVTALLTGGGVMRTVSQPPHWLQVKYFFLL